jgi:oligoribonuclease NrnB/cAMP/cGMP phosphodiesterase (DHH superfamily)
MGKTIVFYHSADLDGWSSGAIVLQKYPDAKAIPINYPILDQAEKLNRLLQVVEDGDLVYVVDFSFSPETFRFIKEKAKQLIWIDHHISAIGKCEEDNFTTDGLLSDQYAACELTWLYIMHNFREIDNYSLAYYNALPLPYSVRLLGRFDLWKHDYDENIVPFQLGLKTLVSMATDPQWKDIFSSNNNLEKQIIERGNIINQFLEKTEYQVAKSYAFEAEIEGHTVVALNMRSGGSSIFKNIFNPEKHAFCVSFLYLPAQKWVVAMYGENNTAVDLSKIAEKYGGGGHKNAAAFTIGNAFDVLKNIRPIPFENRKITF